MFRFFPNAKCSLLSLLNLIKDLIADGLLFFRLLFRSRTALSAEVLFLRKQLVFYEEKAGVTLRDLLPHPVRFTPDCFLKFFPERAGHQVCDELLVRIAGRHLPFGVVRLVVQSHVARIGVKHCNHLGLGVPVGDVVLNKLKVKYRSWQIPFECQGRDAEGETAIPIAVRLNEIESTAGGLRVKTGIFHFPPTTLGNADVEQATAFIDQSDPVLAGLVHGHH